VRTEGELTMRTVFTAYLVIIFGGLAYCLALAVLHR
jgi:hypothetical protein